MSGASFYINSILLGVHVTGAAIWVGGSILLGGIGSAVRAELPEDRRLYSRIMSRIARAAGRVMWGALVITLLTGLYNLTWFLPSWSWQAVVSTPWLTLKLSLVTLLVVVNGVHSFVLGPMIAKRQQEPMARSLSGLRAASTVTAVFSAVLGIAVIFVAVLLAGGA